eukprot:4078864-Prymnesium_polylepis.1
MSSCPMRGLHWMYVSSSFLAGRRRMTPWMFAGAMDFWTTSACCLALAAATIDCMSFDVSVVTTAFLRSAHIAPLGQSPAAATLPE